MSLQLELFQPFLHLSASISHGCGGCCSALCLAVLPAMHFPARSLAAGLRPDFQRYLQGQVLLTST